MDQMQSIIDLYQQAAKMRGVYVGDHDLDQKNSPVQRNQRFLGFFPDFFLALLRGNTCSNT